ncbi:MAG: 23S rRNA (uracil(1939)-C(5))-methyltransferase RlmD [Elusimicrobiota bacterium]|jgi:23S rRNA (uracil-5-)-methyltransferase RumA|nr:23S rRNA (uracil(1939)-C(5))-methyltransferase RlmD [Elusimicrobiota bacterium]
MSFKNKIIKVIAEKIVFPGRSLCRCEDGIVLFTEGLLPSETAEVFVTRDKKSFREGYVAAIIEKSPDRIEPFCPSFNKCGGCSFEHISYQNQLSIKELCVKETLNFTGADIEPIRPSPTLYNYRGKMEFSFFEKDGCIDLGLHRRGSFNQYISVPPCFISDESFTKAAEIVKTFANSSALSVYNNKTHSGFFRHLVCRKAQNNKQGLINIIVNAEGKDICRIFEPIAKDLARIFDSVFITDNSRKSDAVLCDNLHLLAGAESIVEKLNVGGRDYLFNISPFSFFQTNSPAAELLYNETLRMLNPKPSAHLLDLYCGSGAIGISLSCAVEKVVGIEQVKQSVEDACKNAALNNVSNIEFIENTAQEWIKNTKREYFDYIIVDPPRSGLTKDTVAFLINSQAERIIYISCNISTLARDLDIIIKSGKYAANAICPVDMFPHTYHIEAAVCLNRMN